MKLAGLIPAFALALQAETPLAAKLCDMVEHPIQFKSRLVSVRAEVVIAFETQALIDGSCPNEQIWFELGEFKRGHEFNVLNHAWKKHDSNRKKVMATLVGLFETGPCFGHQCFSTSQLRVEQVMNVTAVQRRLAPDFSAYDCSLLRRDIQVRFQKGHIDNVRDGPLFMRALEIVLTGPHEDAFAAEAHPIFQIALTPSRLKVLEPKDGVFRSALADGAYVYTAVASGFQSVTGCLVVMRNANNRKPIRIELPLGV